MPVACVELLDARAGPQGVLDDPEPAVVRHRGPLDQLRSTRSPSIMQRGRHRRPVEAGVLLLQRPQGLLQRLGEAAPDGHRLADALHVRGQRRVGAGELLEGEPRHLDDDVVQASARSDAGVSRVMSLGISSSV